MLREALDYLVGLGRAGRSAVMLDDPSRRAGKIFITPDGSVERIDGMFHESPVLFDQQSFLDFVDKWNNTDASVELWLNDDAFVIWVDNGRQIIEARWTPNNTSAYSGFTQLTETELDQRSAIHLLRRSLFDVVPSAIRDALEVCRWDNGFLTTNTHTNASMGKSVDARAGVLSQVPESFSVSIKKFEEDWCPKCEILVRIIPNPSTQKFDFYPDDDDVTLLERKAVAAAREFFWSTTKRPCFLGTRN